MKKLSFLVLAAAGLLMTACADKDTVADENAGGFLDGKAEGFFKVNLNLPTAPVVSTRGWSEKGDTLNDGLGKEYGVHTCLLLLFDGDSETNATLTQVVSITPNFSNVDDNPNHITTNAEKVVKLENTPSQNLYALVVINGKGNIEMVDKTTISVRKTDGSAMENKSGCKIADLQAALTTSDDVKTNSFIYDESGTDYYFMTNAVLSNEKGGLVAPTTAAGNQHILAPVDKAYIYETEAKATDGHAAADIYVERGMAKVTIKTDASSFEMTALTAGTGITKLAKAQLDGWCLDITNKTSYVVRQVPTGSFWNLCSFSGSAATDKYRFVGGNPVDGAYGTNIAGYRTYWAKDPNYSDDITFDSNNQKADIFSYATFATDSIVGTGDENPLYCFENTFDVAHQDARYTTRAIIGVKLTEGDGDFYIVGADRKTLYALSDVEAQVLTNLKTSSKFTNWYETNGGGNTLTASDITVTWDKPSAPGKIAVQSITIKKSALKTGTEEDKVIAVGDAAPLDGVINTINSQLVNVERFRGGKAYYAIRIKHFGDDLTPWDKDEYKVDANHPEWAPKESTIATIYPDADDHRQEANYLGRYGMVRNNWYELQLGDILKVGSAVPPVIPSHPDDEKEESYIKARINILSWAKRPQTWNLK